RGRQLIVDAREGEFTTYRPLKHHLFALLCQDDPAWERARAEYRSRVDALVEGLWRRAWRERDAQALASIIDDYFPSGWADQAMDGLAQLALQDGQTHRARRLWARCHPRLWNLERPSGNDSQGEGALSSSPTAVNQSS